MKERQSINLFCYLCYVKIRILGKYIHPEFTLKCVCGAAEEARVGLSVCAVSAEGTHVAICKSHPRELFCLLPDQQWRRALGKGAARAEKLCPSNFYSTSISSNLGMLSQAFCCPQSKTCETLSMLVY